jgi:hypothetical protein
LCAIPCLPLLSLSLTQLTQCVAHNNQILPNGWKSLKMDIFASDTHPFLVDAFNEFFGSSFCSPDPAQILHNQYRVQAHVTSEHSVILPHRFQAGCGVVADAFTLETRTTPINLKREPDWSYLNSQGAVSVQESRTRRLGS